MWDLPSSAENSLFQCPLCPSQGLNQEVTDLRCRVTDAENQRIQCEKKLKAAIVSLLDHDWGWEMFQTYRLQRFSAHSSCAPSPPSPPPLTCLMLTCQVFKVDH